MAVTKIAARKLLHGDGAAAGTIAQGVADVGSISFDPWEMVTGFFADILAYLFAALKGAAHLLVLPLELLWQSLVAIATAAAGGIASGLAGLWQHVTGFFAHIFAAIAGAAHQLVLPLETLWQWLATSVQLVAGFLSGAWAAAAGAAHEIPQKLAELWRWVHAAAAAALPYALGVAAVVLVAALLWFCWPALLAVGIGVGQALVTAACYFGRGLFYVGVAAHQVCAFLLPPCALCLRCCAVVTMKAPGAAGMLISRAAFEGAPALYFTLLRAAPPIVAATVFCSRTVAWLFAAPVAALFRASVSAA